ncbi:unnamed protein product, partial [Iphiclides podalirius]
MVLNRCTRPDRSSYWNRTIRYSSDNSRTFCGERSATGSPLFHGEGELGRLKAPPPLPRVGCDQWPFQLKVSLTPRPVCSPHLVAFVSNNLPVACGARDSVVTCECVRGGADASVKSMPVRRWSGDRGLTTSQEQRW